MHGEGKWLDLGGFERSWGVLKVEIGTDGAEKIGLCVELKG